MCTARRLVTSLALDEGAGPQSNTDRLMSISALHELELADGRRVTLLDDRGWAVSGPSNIWSHTSVQDLTDTARVVVGPDEPLDGHSYEEATASHWASLADTAQAQGVSIEAGELATLPHDVEVNAEIQARVSGPSQ